MTPNQLAFLREMDLLAFPNGFIPAPNEIATWRFVDGLGSHASGRMIRVLRAENINLRQAVAAHEAALQTALDALASS